MKKIALISAPLVFLLFLQLPPLMGLSASAMKVLGLALMMLIWWVTEAVALPITALLPLFVLPALGVCDAEKAANPYANPIIFLFMGGFIIAIAMEKWNLHLRIAMNIVKKTGSDANGIILGFMLATAFISMWISNTATTVMMLPIALSVINVLFEKQGQDIPLENKQNFALSLMLGIAYSASIGGIATIIGTPPNSVFAGFMLKTYQMEISFAQWMALGFPFSCILLFLGYWVMIKVYPNRIGKFAASNEIIEQELAKLGRMSKGEKAVSVVFVLTALMWIFRPYIKSMLPVKDFSDTSVAMIAAISLFLIPMNWKEEEFVLDWKDAEKLPWGILLLFGGGMSLADALYEAGIISMIGNNAASWASGNVSFFIICMLLSAVALFITEVMSNVALVTVFLPVVAGIASAMGQNPLFMTIPITIASSCAFMLPMGTPPNAIVFGSGHVQVIQMVKVGFWLNVISILLLTVITYWLLPLVFGLEMR